MVSIKSKDFLETKLREKWDHKIRYTLVVDASGQWFFEGRNDALTEMMLSHRVSDEYMLVDEEIAMLYYSSIRYLDSLAEDNVWGWVLQKIEDGAKEYYRHQGL